MSKTRPAPHSPRASPALSARAAIVLDLGPRSLKARFRGHGWEVPLARGPDGRWTEPTRQALVDALQRLVPSRRRRAATPAVCALPAHGVTLRPLEIPRAGPEETARLLALQVESTLPLPPEELAWGRLLTETRAGPRHATLVAIRRQQVVEIQELLRACDLEPQFTVGALAAAGACQLRRSSDMSALDGRSLDDRSGDDRSGVTRSAAGEPFGLLDVGRDHSELLAVGDEGPHTLRVVPWGGEHLTSAIAQALDLPADEAEQRKRELCAASAWPPELTSVVERALEELVVALRSRWPWTTDEAPSATAVASGAARGPRDAPPRIFLTGGGARTHALASRLAQAWPGIEWTPFPIAHEPGASAVTAGLEEHPSAAPLLQLGVPRATGTPRRLRLERVTGLWLAGFALLALGGWVAHRAAPLRQLGTLRSQLDEARTHVAERARARTELQAGDAELTQLRAIQQSQLPVLEALRVLAEAAPKNTRFEEITLGAQQISLRGTIPSSEAANSLRQGLLEAGLFSELRLDKDPDPKKRTVRFHLAARLKRGAVARPPPLTGEAPATTVASPGEGPPGMALPPPRDSGTVVETPPHAPPSTPAPASAPTPAPASAPASASATNLPRPGLAAGGSPP